MSGQRHLSAVLSALLVGATLAGVTGTAYAADATPPKIKSATVLDTNGNDRVDGVKLTYSEPVSHALDKDGSYPFSVAGYLIKQVGAAKGKTLVIKLKEHSSSDIEAQPPITYTRTNDDPVKDLAGNQAAAQTFAKTQSLDPDGDGYTVADGDCDPHNGDIHPGALDLPDPGYVDSNCDGIDGDQSLAVFVSTAGIDIDGCGSIDAPCATIQHSIDVASGGGLRDVYVAGGVYGNAAFSMANGINVFGGFGQNFQRDPTKAIGPTVGEVHGNDGVDVDGDPQALTVLAENLSEPSTVAYLTLFAPDGSDQVDGNGKGSYDVVVKDVGPHVLTLDSDQLVGGYGAEGATGTPGADAPTVERQSYMNGGTGGNGAQFNTFCDNTSHGAGGSAGTNTNPDGGLPMSGGAGGDGGTMDTTCTFPFNFDATPGKDGSDASHVQINFGRGGHGGTGTTQCGPDTDGSPGSITNGSGGPAVSSGGSLTGDFWYAAAGGAGGAGSNGGGGGGGGGEGGCDNGTQSYGAGGGGGGAGGDAARGGGGGGGGGGGSFVVYLINASPTLTNDALTLGSGGAGGAGGAGGRGQSGGLAGPGGTGTHWNGGAGGAGGHGGHGGGGAGGDGGDAVGIFETSAASNPSMTGVTFNGGGVGPGGTGGPSAPGAPVGEQDGNPGASGFDGTVANTWRCANPSGC